MTRPGPAIVGRKAPLELVVLMNAKRAKTAKPKFSLRALRPLRSDRRSRQASHAAVSPLRRDEADQRKEERRHVPQLALFDDCDAAAAVTDRLRERRGVGRREEAA